MHALVQEVMNLQARYLCFYDQLLNRHSDRPTGDYIVNELFTETGIWASENTDVQMSYHGKKELVKMFDDVAEQYRDYDGMYVKHFSMNPQIEINGNEAINNEQFLVLYSDKRKKERFWVVGHYLDILEKNSHNEWRFRKKTAFIEDISCWS